jgi:hypothetical protein
MISKLDKGNGTEGSLGWVNEGLASGSVLTANTDESEPELAWADPRVGEICSEVFLTGDQLNLSAGYTGSHHFPAHAALWLCLRLHCRPGSFDSACCIKAAECEVIRAEKINRTPRWPQ